MKTQEGFSIIELLLVFTIVGIILGIVIPAFMTQAHYPRASRRTSQVQTTENPYPIKYVPDVQGLTPKEVISKLGLPGGKFTIEGHETWKYDGKTVLMFRDGKVDRQDNL